MSLYEGNTGKKYFTPAEKKALDKFLSDGPTVKKIYTNGAGSQMQVTRIFLPIGTVTDDTIESEPLRDGTKGFHTPGARSEARHAKVALIDLSHKDGPRKLGMTSTEWFDWLGGDFTVEDVPPPNESPAAAAERAQAHAKLMRRHGDDKQKKEVEALEEKKKQFAAPKGKKSGK